MLVELVIRVGDRGGSGRVVGAKTRGKHPLFPQIDEIDGPLH